MSRFGANREFALCDGCGHPRMAHYGGGCHCGCRSAKAPGRDLLPPDSPPRTERDRLSDALRTQVVVARAASRSTPDLAREAAQLRRDRRPEAALPLARAAVEAATTLHEATMAATVLTATLSDLWRDEEARQVGERALRRDPASAHLLCALGRAWMLGLVATGIEEFRTRAHECFRLAEAADRAAA